MTGTDKLASRGLLWPAVPAQVKLIIVSRLGSLSGRPEELSFTTRES